MARRVAPEHDLSRRVERIAAPLRMQVLDLLRQEIAEMRLRPGQRLVERELIERIGVSRTTIREALRELAAEGLVRTIPQRGAIVAAPSLKDAREVYEVRALLEGLAAREFAERASEEKVQALRDAFKVIEDGRDSDDTGAMLRAKNGFYEALFDGAGNDTIRSILAGLHTRVAVMRATSMSAPGRPQKSLEEIRAIVEAIERRDADAAAEASAHHVRRAAATLFAQLQSEPGQANA